MLEQMALSGVKAGHNDVLIRGADVARAIKSLTVQAEANYGCTDAFAHSLCESLGGGGPNEGPVLPGGQSGLRRKFC